jgi:hypothetical protein
MRFIKNNAYRQSIVTDCQKHTQRSRREEGGGEVIIEAEGIMLLSPSPLSDLLLPSSGGNNIGICNNYRYIDIDIDIDIDNDNDIDIDNSNSNNKEPSYHNPLSSSSNLNFIKRL